VLHEFTFWIIFSIVVFILLVIDLYFTEHRGKEISLKASLIWSGIWISSAVIFDIFLYFYLFDGHTKAIEFITGYLIEKSLSVDNLFVFLMIFRVMNVPRIHQPHVLKWGIIGAVVFRVLFIIAGVSLIKVFHPIIYVFGAILLYAAYKMAFGGDQSIDMDKNPFIKFLRKHFKLLPSYEGRKFIVKKDHKLFITSMLLTLVLIESSDIVFAMDSIPAVIAITRDSFIIISSNIFAILGLRALYFALSGIVEIFTYLKYGVAIILFYVGIKMLASEIIEIPTLLSLGIISFLLVGSILLSLIRRRKFEK
jgi:TerC family integral membrane protein